MFAGRFGIVEKYIRLNFASSLDITFELFEDFAKFFYLFFFLDNKYEKVLLRVVSRSNAVLTRIY